MKRYKVIVMGWDGATWDLLRPWAEEGHLPTISRLLAEGAAGELRSIIPPTTAPAWTSMTTGTNPGKHGLMDWITRRKDGYRSMPVTADLSSQKTMWELLSEAGHRVFTFNIPMTYPATPINGLVVAGLGTPSVESEFTYPAGLYQEIVDHVGEYELYPNPGQPDSDAQVEAFLERLYRVTDLHFETLDYLRSRDDWHSWMAVVSGTDAILHVMWHFLDEKHSRYEPERAQRFGREVLRFYQHVDGALGKLVDSLDDDTVLFLVSDHGFGPLEKWFHVNTWLLQEGFIVLNRRFLTRIKHVMFKLGFSPMNVYDILRTIGLGKLKEQVTAGRGPGRLRALLPLVFLSFDDVDWSRSQAYAMGQIGPIYLNLKGREPEGIVEPGPEADAIWEQIVEALRQVRDPESGVPVMGEVYRPEELYSGRNVGRAADIIFLPPWEEPDQIPGFGEADFGSNRVITRMRRGTTGVHRMNGILVAWGEPVRKGHWLEGANLIDVAPTALHLAGLPVPEDMDGRVLTDALAGEFADPHSVRFGPPAARDTTTQDSNVLSDEDQAIIEERLRGLGYAA